MLLMLQQSETYGRAYENPQMQIKGRFHKLADARTLVRCRNEAHKQYFTFILCLKSPKPGLRAV